MTDKVEKLLREADVALYKAWKASPIESQLSARINAAQKQIHIALVELRPRAREEETIA